MSKVDDALRFVFEKQEGNSVIYREEAIDALRTITMYEGRIPFKTQTFSSLNELKGLHFHEFDINRYPLVSLAEVVLKKKGTYGTVLNRSNEVAVWAYLENKIAFLDIEKIIFKCMKEHKNITNPTLQDILRVDYEIEAKAKKMVEKIMMGGSL